MFGLVQFEYRYLNSPGSEGGRVGGNLYVFFIFILFMFMLHSENELP